MASGLIISGQFGDICIREKADDKIELGELMITETEDAKILLQVFDLVYGSQLNQQNLELVSGLKLEEDSSLQLMDAHLRNYVLAKVKNLITIKGSNAATCKTLPNFFSLAREVRAEDLSFFSTPKNPLNLGLIRSGSKVINVPAILDGRAVFSHHVLVSGTTGKGKSVLMKNLLWECVDKSYCGLLVLDPHDEYYGKTKYGLKDHPLASEYVKYYSPTNPPPGCITLKINLGHLKPHHFNGVVDWSEPQQDALYAYYKENGQGWVEAIVTGKPLANVKFAEATIDVVKRKIMQLLNITVDDSKTIVCNGVFDTTAGQTTLKDIVRDLVQARKIIIDTSELSGPAELLVGSLVSHEILEHNRRVPAKELEQKPVVSIILEEAPRVLGKDALERGPNVFATIAREGRKFNVGITAITQLPSLIPREILANMNTKIILGTELKQERQAIIESSTQDLSTEDRLIASLDKGEAIITSTFTRFATPIKVPFFDEKVLLAKNSQKKYASEFSGVKIS